ncbi:serine/threonine protein phosphatase, putative [Eimeria mitis]|uniref:Serine/threonine protein phosphatase, putative n=1 Tax=Eimeria mitis TaxID=44415 RepID=U6JZ95_9EIME|nr:serine/threonine protein phosphatase, putative [Eimeria mitis]CDJ30066.1 serine/threonine protein phosphatase, putative [Eimeria mitis]
MKLWHEQESVDIALGLGDFLQPPGMLSVKDPGLKEKWHDIFIKDAGLNIPWYMVNGEAESMVSSSTPYRYHYTRQDVNYHNPNWLYKAVITMVANLTTADGGTEDQEFTVHLISIDTWALFGGPPFYENLGQYQNNMIALSNALYHSAKAKADWIVVQGHHPLTSTGAEAEEARFTYIDDMVKAGRPRGPEHRLVDLLTAYQVDAYISAHDDALEYVTMSDLDKNSTLAFITSGGGTRIMSGVMGRGWLGKIRGRIFPLLCWSGKRIFYKLDPGGCKRIFYKLDPGGCKPSEKDQALAYKFYAPQGPNWKISVKERILNTTGFSSLKFTKDFLIVDFISSSTDLKLKELNIDHEAFEEENRERVASEIAFQTRTPILAERLRLYEKELVDMYNEYQHLKSKKAMYETMNAQKAAALEAQGENLRESELSEGMYEQTERIIELMYVIAAHHGYMWTRYEALKEQRKKLPLQDAKQAEALLKLEKKLIEVMKKRRELNKKYVDQGNHPTPADAEQIKEFVIKSRILKRDINEFEQVMQEEEAKEAGEKEGEKEENTEQNNKTTTEEELPEIKPLDQSIEARLERKRRQLEEHERVLQTINSLAAIEREKMKEDIGMLQRQHEKLRAEVERLEGILNRKEWAADRRPSELWEKRLQKHDLEQTLTQLEAYKESILTLPKVQRRTKDLNDAVASIDMQKIDIEEQLMELSDELYNTTPTPLQEKFIQQLDKLREVSLLVDSRNTMPAEALEDPEIQKSLKEANEALELLQLEVDTADEALRKELNDLDEAWLKRMIIRGADMKQLAEEFSIDINQVLDEDAKAREADPNKQLKWKNVKKFSLIDHIDHKEGF